MLRSRSSAVGRATTHVMSCSASVLVVGGRRGAGDEAVRRLHELEQRWSRFLPDSEVSRLNASHGRAMRVSADTVRLVEEMVQAWHLTTGAYDPTMLRPLVEAGYRSSRVDQQHATELDPSIAPRGRVEGIRVDAAAGVVQLPAGTAIDPGGIGKGLAADLVVGELLDAGADGALVEIGGDLAVRGRAPDGHAWTVAVTEGPDDPNPPSIVRLTDGGVATSTTKRRRWKIAGQHQHHLIDPATLACSSHSVRTCSVIAGTAAQAEAFTKVAFCQSPAAALRTLDDNGLAGCLTDDGGQFSTSMAWNHFEWKAAS